jgi:hypothetical protein
LILPRISSRSSARVSVFGSLGLRPWRRAREAAPPGRVSPTFRPPLPRGACRPGDPPLRLAPLRLAPPPSPGGSGSGCAEPAAKGEQAMRAPRFITIDGKPYLWADLVRQRREQLQATAKAAQPALFVLLDERG